MYLSKEKQLKILKILNPVLSGPCYRRRIIMGFFDKIKEMILGKPVTGVAIISEVEEVESFLEDIVDEAFEKEQQNNE